jgi:hypothetical protein
MGGIDHHPTEEVRYAVFAGKSNNRSADSAKSEKGDDIYIENLENEEEANKENRCRKDFSKDLH